MVSLAQYRKNVQRMAAAYQNGVQGTMRKAALVVDQALVLSTPVDTGRARSNWNVSLDGPDLEEKEPTSAQAALAEGKRVIESYESGKNRSIHITNNVPYVVELDKGSSSQAPKGFVDDAIREGVEFLKRAKVLRG